MNAKRQKDILTSQEILQILTKHKNELMGMGVRKIGLFGSFRRDTPDSSSDIDFLVVLERQSFDAYMNVKFFLEDLFGCQVDLVLEDTIKPRLRPYIMKEVVYAQGL